VEKLFKEIGLTGKVFKDTDAKRNLAVKTLRICLRDLKEGKHPGLPDLRITRGKKKYRKVETRKRMMLTRLKGFDRS